MQGTDSMDGDWSMSERRERTVMRDVPQSGVKPDLPEADDFKLPTRRGLLSKEEIQALLRPDLPRINEEPAASGAERPLDMTRDFNAPTSSGVVEGRRLAARLSRAFGQFAGLKAAITFDESSVFQSLEDTRAAADAARGSAYLCFGGHGNDMSHVLCLSEALANLLVSNACGGQGAKPSATTGRPLSAIDCALIEQLMGPFSAVLGQDVSFISIETDWQYVMSLMPAPQGEAFAFSLHSGGESSEVTLLTLSGAEEAPSAAIKLFPGTGKRPVTAVLTARIATLSVPVRRISRLKPGDTLLLGLPADQPVQLLSGGRDGVVTFEGDIGRKGDRMAVRVKRCV